MTHILNTVRKIWNNDYDRRWLKLFFYLMLIFELPYRVSVAARNYLYDRGILKTKKLPCVVISVGNIVAGGTGKTPTVIMLAKLLKGEGFKPAVLSRGYGGNSTKPFNVVSDGINILAGYRNVGDEPILISKMLSGIPVITGKNKFAIGEITIKKFRSDVVILDDGFQYRSLYRDIDIVLLDSKKPIGNGHLLPSGSLRESPNNLHRADVILLTGSQSGDNSKPGNLPPSILQNQESLFYSYHKPLDIQVCSEDRFLSLDYLQDKKVFAFSGIGNPTSFYKTIESLKATIVDFIVFPDHHVYSKLDIEKISEQARRCRSEIILTTEKDGIRLQGHVDFLPKILILRIEISIIPNSDAFRKLLLEKLK